MKGEYIYFIRFPPYYNYRFNHPQDVPFPFTSGYMATLLEKEGYKVKIADLWAQKISINVLKNQILENGILVFMNTITPILNVVEKFSNDLKKEKDIKIISYGQHSTFHPRTILGKNSPIDFCLIGEPEWNIIDNVNEILKKNDKNYLKEVSYYDNDQGKIFIPEKYYLKPDLDNLPYINYELFPIRRYRKISFQIPALRRVKWGFILSSRGCFHRCVFCSPTSRQSLGNIMRFHSPARILEEIEILTKKYGINALSFEDDLFTGNIDRLSILTQSIKEASLKIPWIAQTRVSSLDDTILRALKGAGCFGLSLGIESGSERILKTLIKDVSLNELREKIKTIKQYGFYIRLLYMIGSPGEDEDDLIDTFNLARELDSPAIQVAFCTPYPGSMLFDNKKPITDEFYNFSDYNSLSINLSNVSNDKLLEFHKFFYRKYYLSFRYLKKYLRFRLKGLILNIDQEFLLILKTLQYLFKTQWNRVRKEK